MSDALPSEKKILKQMEKLVPQVDIDTMSVKKFIKALSKQMGVNLKVKKAFIQETLTVILDKMDGEGGEEDVVLKKKSAQKKAGRGSGLNKEKELSPELAEFIGKPMESRPQVVKAMWDYFKAKNLQNPKDKRIILLDDRLKALFNVEKFTMFQLAKYIGAHIHPFKPVNLNELSEGSKKKKEDKKRKAAEEAKNGVKKRKAGTGAPYHLSEQMTKITGKSILPRPQVIQALWVYIKENDLQNQDDKREIICDELLQKVMGGKSKVTMFSMNKYVSSHILEKADKDDYARQEASGGSKDGANKGRVKSEDQVPSKGRVKSEGLVVDQVTSEEQGSSNEDRISSDEEDDDDDSYY